MVKRIKITLNIFLTVLAMLFVTGCANEKTPSDVLKETEMKTESTSDTTNDIQTQIPSQVTAGISTDKSAEERAEEPTEVPVEESTELPETTNKPFVMGFAGDINLTDSYQNMVKLKNAKNGLSDCITQKLLDKMNDVDIMMLNNEFAFSERGTRAPGKDYTFRSKPENVTILKDMGVDIVSLANNHALDFGRDALDDTFTVLEDAGIDYVGAGINSDRASKVIIYENQGKRIGCIATSRVIYQDSWVAGSKSGMQSAYNLKSMLASIKNAKEQCDFLVVYIHWGVEYNDYPEQYQRDWAKQYIDAGADAVVGCHPHVIQGIELYKGCPIIYSMGNFWFNSAEKNSMYAELTINEDNSSSLCVYPCYNKNCRTYLIEGKSKQEKYFNALKKLSYNVKIGDDGYVKSAEAEDN